MWAAATPWLLLQDPPPPPRRVLACCLRHFTEAPSLPQPHKAVVHVPYESQHDCCHRKADACGQQQLLGHCHNHQERNRQQAQHNCWPRAPAAATATQSSRSTSICCCIDTDRSMSQKQALLQYHSTALHQLPCMRQDPHCCLYCVNPPPSPSPLSLRGSWHKKTAVSLVCLSALSSTSMLLLLLLATGPLFVAHHGVGSGGPNDDSSALLLLLPTAVMSHCSPALRSGPASILA